MRDRVLPTGLSDRLNGSLRFAREIFCELRSSKRIHRRSQIRLIQGIIIAKFDVLSRKVNCRLLFALLVAIPLPSPIEREEEMRSKVEVIAEIRKESMELPWPVFVRIFDTRFLLLGR